jgi:hypothetical protein
MVMSANTDKSVFKGVLQRTVLRSSYHGNGVLVKTSLDFFSAIWDCQGEGGEKEEGRQSGGLDWRPARESGSAHFGCSDPYPFVRFISARWGCAQRAKENAMSTRTAVLLILLGLVGPILAAIQCCGYHAVRECSHVTEVMGSDDRQCYSGDSRGFVGISLHVEPIAYKILLNRRAMRRYVHRG